MNNIITQKMYYSDIFLLQGVKNKKLFFPRIKFIFMLPPFCLRGQYTPDILIMIFKRFDYY